jgi:hypothetical protein
MKLLVAIVIMCAFVVGMAAGAEFGYRQRDALPDKVLKLTQTCPMPTDRLPVCTKSNVKDFINKCGKKWL